MTAEHSDRYDLQRFLDAQARSYTQARAELTAGEKCSHWMWFIFPQIQGLGFSSMAQRYAITSLEEAHAYLVHPVLGQRLRECTALVIAVEGRSLHDIFGSPDDMKFHSSITLFAGVDEGPDCVFVQALQKFFAGQQDLRTTEILSAGPR